MMTKCKILNAFLGAFAISLLGMGTADAVTINEFVEKGFLQTGGFLFVCGVILLFIPKLTKLGIVITLVADAIVVSRILFQPEIIRFLNEKGAEPYLADLSGDDVKLFIAIISVIFILCLAALGYLKGYLWVKFWRLLGFYKTEDEQKAIDEARKRKIEARIARKEKEKNRDIIDADGAKNSKTPASRRGAEPKIAVDDVFAYDRDISLDLDKASEIVLGEKKRS